MTGYLYKITNKENGMCYIGKSIKFPSYRWDWHIKESFFRNPKSKFHIALREFGLTSWCFEIIHIFESAPYEADWHFLETLDSLEITCIRDYDSIKNGYNTKLGSRINRNPLGLCPISDFELYTKYMNQIEEYVED